MPIRFTIDGTTRVVVAVVEPPAPSAADVAAFLDAVLAHPDFRPGMGVLYDRRRVDPPDRASMEAVAAAIRERADRLGPYRWAVVAADLDTVGMVRYGQVHHAGSGVEGRAFGDPAEALAWLRQD